MKLKKLFEYMLAIGSYYSHMKRDFIFSSLLMILISGVNVLSPYFLSCSVNAITALRPNYHYFYLFVILFGLSWTTSNTLEWVKNIVSATFLVKAEAAMHMSVFKKIIHAKKSILRDTPAGQIIEDISRGRTSLVSLIHTFFWGLFPLLIQIAFSLFFIIRSVGLVLSLFFFITLCLFFFTSYLFSRASETIHQRIMNAHNRVTGHLAEKLSMLDDIKMNNAFDKEIIQIHKVTDNFISVISSGNKKIGGYMIYQSILLGIMLIAFTCYAAALTTHGMRPAGDYILISGYIIQLTAPLILVGGSFINIRKDFAALNRLGIFLALDEAGKPTDSPSIASSNTIFAARGMDIVVDGRPIVQNLYFTISQNHMIAITGASGSGKTSLLKTMLAINETQPGTLFFRGQDINQLATDDIVAQCAVVPQQPIIFSGSLRDNLTYGCCQAVSDAKLTAIIHLLQLDDIKIAVGASQLLEEQISPDHPLSGGEKQRIAIGRALARGKSILIMDEPSSALDDQLAARIFENLKSQGLTIIMVTHKTAFCAMADATISLRHAEQPQLALPSSVSL